MKKLSILALAVFLVVAFTLPAAAVENIFGGYWRTRAYMMQDFSGDDSGDKDLSQIDTRTRLYYTAKFSDSLKFVNKFEMDAVWGGPKEGYGDVGTDGVKVEVKNAYVDFKLGETFAGKVGVMGGALANGFLFDSDYAGAQFTFNFGNTKVPFHFIRFYEGGAGDDANEQDVNAFAITPTVNVTDDFAIKTTFFYLMSEDGTGYSETEGLGEDLDLYALALDFGFTAGPADVGVVGVYQGGSFDDNDISAWLLDLKAAFDVGKAKVHAEALIASGDDDADGDIESYVVTKGHSYYWAEIMGYGTIDNDVPNGAPGDAISNLVAFNLGTSVNLAKDVEMSLDVWHAMLAEENENGDDELGTEIDIKVTMPIVDKLKLDLVGAYLTAGDVIGDEDPLELGARLSLSF